MDKKKVAQEIFEHMNMTKEQYEVFKGLADDFELDVPENEPTWEELLG